MMTEAKTSVGQVLRQTRRKAGRSLADIAADLKIREQYLRALERGKYEDLPPVAYAAGFVRSYAALLGLDARALAQAFRDEVGGETITPDLHFPEPIAESRLPGRALLVTGLAAVLMVYFGWLADFADNGAGTATAGSRVEPVPARLEELAGQATDADTAPAGSGHETAPDATAETTAPAADREAAATAPGMTAAEPQTRRTMSGLAIAALERRTGGRVTVTAEREAWVRIVDADEREVWSGVLRPGESWSPRSTADLRLMTSNAAAVVVSVDGVPLAPLGANGALVRGLPLDPAQLHAQRSVAFN
ncbi:MAG: helix-turn-helix domain-containing protein [Alphaproteobacteria bacterium]|nr:MAG: helix-turn-helix domain-containing protein [Alphaproteobacteria bacterium]